jgi:hypothetical protein
VNDFFERVKRYGDKVADTITLVCTQHKYLQEIRVSLALDFATDRDLPQMVANARPAPPRGGLRRRNLCRGSRQGLSSGCEAAVDQQVGAGDEAASGPAR